MTNILIPGGAGYIGSHCIRELQKAGYNCIVYDNFSEGHLKAVQGFEVVEGDLLDTGKLIETIKKYNISGVIHFAAFALVGVSMREPLEYYQNNITGTISLLEAMKQTGVKNIVFSSTCATYGENVSVPITEETLQNPCNPYGESKLAVEWLLECADTAYGIKSVSLRYFNAAGAETDGSIGEDHLLETHLIPLVLREALNVERKMFSTIDFESADSGHGYKNEKKLHVFGVDYPTPDGSCIRDYIHVLDLADAHVRALKYLEENGETTQLNLGTGIGVSVLEIINAAREVTGIDINYNIGDRRPGDPPELVASAEKAKKVLGWVPQRSNIKTIITDAWNWHKANPKGYDDR
ncbi:MAG: UDP-glucose 4-epimerase [Lachnospiraceae bacterium]|nr:UDP-glucose 4-epimerase [Lachnospiraceae bacterium]